MQMKNKRKVELDYVRIVACLMVVGIHVVEANNYTNPKSVQWIMCNVCDLALWGCVPIFFMISGAILFDKNVNYAISPKRLCIY